MASAAMQSLARVLRNAPRQESDASNTMFTARSDGGGPRGPMGQGFGLPAEMMAPMPMVQGDVMDSAVMTPEWVAHWDWLRKNMPEAM